MTDVSFGEWLKHQGGLEGWTQLFPFKTKISMIKSIPSPRNNAETDMKTDMFHR